MALKLMQSAAKTHFTAGGSQCLWSGREMLPMQGLQPGVGTARALDAGQLLHHGALLPPHFSAVTRALVLVARRGVKFLVVAFSSRRASAFHTGGGQRSAGHRG